jgi:hypothetical protein
MNSKRRRNFYLLDAIVLIAATAAGIAGYIAVGRYLEQEVQPPPPARDGEVIPFTSTLPFRVHDFCRGFPCLLAASGVAVLLLKLRSPRPRLRRVFGAPGAAACLTVLVMLTVRAAELLLVWIVSVLRPLNGFTVEWMPSAIDILTSVDTAAGPGIIAVWVILAVNRTLYLSRDWLEIFALAVALGWILLQFETPVCNFLYSLN